MKKRRIKYFSFSLLIILIFSKIALTQGRALDFSSSTKHSFTIILEENITEYIINSEIVLIDSVVEYSFSGYTANLDFSFNQSDSRLEIKSYFTFGNRAIVYGRLNPIDGLSLTFRKRTPRARNLDSTATFPIQEHIVPLTTGEDYSTLFRSGSLTRAFNLGSNQGLELKSGLNMQLQGKVGQQYSINAVLTDQSTPLQPEGNTRTLSEIDKIFIAIDGPGLSATFGDIIVSRKSTELGRFERKLKGVTANTSIKNNKVGLTFASSEGTFHSLRLIGSEGNQGPYILKGKNGERDILILAGTEKVFIDGDRMTRGEDEDYVIDYATGHVFFTRNRLITGYSRITVDFEYSDGRFGKMVSGASIESAANESGFNYSLSYFREADTKDNPRLFDYTEIDRELLSIAGDSTLRAVRSGVQYAGEGNGNYVRETQNGEDIFVWSESGDYKVSFSDVGEGNGDYAFVRLSVYEYAGKNMGRYLPVIDIPVPQSKNLSNLSFEYKDKEGRFSVSGEAAHSENDRNMLSSGDDGDNGGNAFRLSLKSDKVSLKKAGTASFSARMRKTNPTFEQIDRDEVVEFDRKWNVDQIRPSGEEIVELDVEYALNKSLTIVPAFGFIDLGNGISTKRFSTRSDLNSNDKIKASYNVENLKSRKNEIDDSWLRQKMQISYLWKDLTPTIQLEKENKKVEGDTLSGFSFDDRLLKLAYNPMKSILISAEYQERDDEVYENSMLIPFSNSFNARAHASYRLDTRLLADINIVRREREFSHSEKTETVLANVKINARPMNGALSTRMDYQRSSEHTPQREKIYIPVEEGYGYYSLDTLTGEYYPDQEGEFELRTFTTDILEGIKKDKFAFAIDLNPSLHIKKDKKSWMKSARSQSIVRYEKGVTDNSGEEQLVKFKRLSAQNDIFLFEQSEKFNLRFRQNYLSSIDNRYVSRSESRTLSEFSFKIRGKLSDKLFYEGNTGLSTDSKRLPILNQTQKIRRVKGDFRLSIRPDRQMEYGLAVDLADEKDRSVTSPIEVKYISLKPGFKRSFLRSGRLSGDFQYFYVDADERELLPYDYAQGHQPGNSYNWSTTFDYRTSSNITVKFNYRGESSKRYENVVHRMRAELQVFF